MIEILLIAAIVFAGRSMFDHAKAARKASEGSRLKEAAKAFGGTMPKHKVKATARRHTLGWWLREAGNGFPVARTGWHAGWIAHRTEYLQHAGHREDARTRHVEAQADAAEKVKDHAERRAAARARRDAILAQADSAPTFGAKEGSRKEVQKAADAVVLPFAPRDRPHAPLPADTVGKPEGKPEPGPFAKPEPQPVARARRWNALCPHCDAQPGECCAQDCPNYSARRDWPAATASPRLSSHVRPGDPLCQTCDGTGGPAGGQCPECLGWGTGPGDPESPEAAPDAICSACGNPSRPGDPVLRDGNDLTHRSHITDDIARREALRNVNNVSSDAARNPTDPTSPEDPAASRDDTLSQPQSSTATEGAPMSGDTSYSTVLNRSRAFVAEADQQGAAIQATLNAAIADADAMQGAEVDSATLGEQMDLIDRLQAAQAAWSAVGEQGSVVANGVQTRHGGLDEAHRDAPVAAAKREFYGD